MDPLNNSTVTYETVTIDTGLYVRCKDAKNDLATPNAVSDIFYVNLSQLYNLKIVAYDVLKVTFDWFADDYGWITDNYVWAQIKIFSDTIFERNLHAVKGTMEQTVNVYQRYNYDDLSVTVSTRALAGALGGDAVSEISNVVLTLRIYYISG